MTNHRVRQPFATRWADNDQYGHLNNTVYYQAMDTAINTWLIDRAGLDPRAGIEGRRGAQIALCAASDCEFHASASFPDPLEVVLGVERLGTSSVTWSLGIAPAGEDGLLASGRFVHVFVDAATRTPTPIDARIRGVIEQTFAPVAQPAG